MYVHPLYSYIIKYIIIYYYILKNYYNYILYNYIKNKNSKKIRQNTKKIKAELEFGQDLVGFSGGRKTTRTWRKTLRAKTRTNNLKLGGDTA